MDFVIELGRKVFAIEVKAATRWSEERSFRLAGISGADARLRRRRAGLQREGSRETGRAFVCHPDWATAGVTERNSPCSPPKPNFAGIGEGRPIPAPVAQITVCILSPYGA